MKQNFNESSCNASDIKVLLHVLADAVRRKKKQILAKNFSWLMY